MIKQLKQFNKWLEGLQADLTDQKKNIKKERQKIWEEGNKAGFEMGETAPSSLIEEQEESECCGAPYIGETDLCSKCKEHTGREV